MTFFYDLNKRLAGLTESTQLNEGKSKPDFLDIDKDGDKKEAMKKAARDKADKIKESYDDMEEGNEFSGELAKAKASGAKSFKVDGKEYQVTESGDVMDEQWMTEKFDQKVEIDPDKKDMFKGKTKAELQKQLSKLKASGPHEKGSAAFTKMKQLQFAIRAKSDWGKVSESDVTGLGDSKYDNTGDIPLKGKSSAGTDFEAAKAEKKVKLKTDRGVEPGADLDEDAEPVRYNDDKPAYNGMTFESVTRKHFQQVADLLTNIENMEKRRELAQHHADIFASQNPRFSKEKFFKAVGLDTLEEDMKVGDTRKSSTGGTIEKLKKGVRHTAKEYDPDAEEPEAPKRKRGGQSKDIGKKEYSFPKDEKALAAHKKQPKGKVHAMKEEELDEKSVSKSQQRFFGMVDAAKKGEKPASKEVAKVAKGISKKAAHDFAATKHKGLPEKVKEDEKNYPSDVPTVGDASSVSTPGLSYGKGVYESLNAKLESLIKLNESVDVQMARRDVDGAATESEVIIRASGAEADMVKDLLKNAGLLNYENDILSRKQDHSEESCGSCGHTPCECGSENNQDDVISFELSEEDVSVSLNEPDYPTNGEESDDALQYSGGLNGPKSTGQTTTPVIASQLRRQATMEDTAETDSFLNLFKVFKNISK